MRRRTLHRLFGSPGSASIGLMLNLTTMTERGQNASAHDKEKDLVQEMTFQAKKADEQFSKTGGKPGDASDPKVKWAAALWQYREKHPASPATAAATLEA